MKNNILIKQLEQQIEYLTKQIYLSNEMFNKLEDGVYITDDKGTTLYVNDAFLQLSGLTREEIIGKTVVELRKTNILPNSCCAKVIETGNTIFTINNYSDGQKCLVSGSPIFDDNGVLVRTIAVIRDVSELDRLMKNIAIREDLFLKSTNKSIKSVGISKNENRFVSNCQKVKEIFEKAKRIAEFDSTMLILGETGVGKDYLAEYIYNTWNIKNKGSFVKINCGAIPEQLMESELFGYEEGAFSGASKGGKIGLLEKANNGVVFLDEIGDMPYTLQVKLLTVINDRIFYRIGGIKPVRFTAKIIAATNANLPKLCNEKKFRWDLYYRLNVVNFTLPPLRERREDIVILAQQFLDTFNSKYSKNHYFSPQCLKKLVAYDWPGNIREIKNIIERLVLISDSPCINANLFKDQLIIGTHENNISDNTNNDKNSHYDIVDTTEYQGTLKNRIEIFEKLQIISVLNSSSTLKEAANILGIDISTLVRKKQRYEL